MMSMRTVWAIRFVGLILLLLSVFALFPSGDVYGWLCDLPGDAGRLGCKLGNVVTFGIPILTAASLRLIMLGLHSKMRIGLVLLIFFGLSVLVWYSPEITGDTSRWAGEGVGFALWLFVFPAGAASLVLAAMPMFDARVQSRRATAPH